MPDLSETHRLRIIKGRYWVAACTCRWTGPRRSTRTTAFDDGSEHVRRHHQTAIIASPTILDWTKVRSDCTCGWTGRWHRAGGTSNARLRAHADAERHRQQAIGDAWEATDA